MVLDEPGAPLRAAELPDPARPDRARFCSRSTPAASAGPTCTSATARCGPRLPLVLGHQIVASARSRTTGARVGVPWLAWACGACRYCRAGTENLCDRAQFTGLRPRRRLRDPLRCRRALRLAATRRFDDIAVAPLLCAGLIGYRALRMTGDPRRLGLYGFGASAHIVCQVAVHEGREVHAFVRAGDEASAAFARELGAVSAGDALRLPPEELDAAIIFAPAGELVVAALRAVRKGGIVVCAGIHMSDIPSFPYSDLWGERVLRSVANLTRADGHGFLDLAPSVGVVTRVTEYPLERADAALEDLRAGRLDGAAVLRVAGSQW